MAWRLRNKEKASASVARWDEANPEKVRAYSVAYSAKRRGATSSTPEVLALIASHKGMPCTYCSAPSTTTDHVVPVSSGLAGVQDAENLVPACSTCNESKSAKDLDEWLGD